MVLTIGCHLRGTSKSTAKRYVLSREDHVWPDLGQACGNPGVQPHDGAGPLLSARCWYCSGIVRPRETKNDHHLKKKPLDTLTFFLFFFFFQVSKLFLF